jgi:hypothetical protein
MFCAVTFVELTWQDVSWIAAEKACDAALNQHRSGKGYWRRAKARKMLGRIDDAIKGDEACASLFLDPGLTKMCF